MVVTMNQKGPDPDDGWEYWIEENNQRKFGPFKTSTEAHKYLDSI